MSSAIRIEKVDVLFGPRPQKALALLEAGAGRAEILARTGHTLAVHDASLEVAEGELCVLMGLSGSGKSTLLRCVNGLCRVTRGRILVADGARSIDVGRADGRALRRLRRARVAMVFQQFALMPWLTIRENVAFGLRLRGLPRADRFRTADRVLEMVRLSDWASRYPRELSGGMQQRVGLARAVATDADILLMDEPFSALDPLIRGHLQDELLDLQQRLQKTILFVSHDLDEALKLGRRIAIMEAGRIVQTGPPETIVTQPASDHVARFVANVNPLNVLSGGTLMRRIAAAPAAEVDAGRLRVVVDNSGRPLSAWEKDRKLALTTDELAIAAGADDVVAALPVSTPMRVVLRLWHATGRPVLMVEDGRLTGLVGEAELVAGLLRQPAAPRATDEAAE